jgi:DNA primase
MPFEELYSELKSRLNILDLVSQYVKLKRVGKNYVGHCPFHSERTPSFTVSHDKGIFKCFGCGAAGDVITFYMKIKGLDFKQAILDLAERCGISVDESLFAQKRKEKTLAELNYKVARFYHAQLLRSEEAEKARSYLKERGISEETIREFMLGYAPSNGRILSSLLRVDAKEIKQAEELGLIRRVEDGGYIDLFRDRVIIPIFNEAGECVGFAGRTLVSKSEPKYLNSPDSQIFKKSEILYGLFQTKKQIKQKGKAYIVEGYFDLLTLWQKGLDNAVATCGTALTERHVAKLKNLAEEITLLFDGDEAGRKATLRAISLFIAQGILPNCVVLPYGEDPDSFFRSKGKVEGSPDAILASFTFNALEFIQKEYQEKVLSKPKSAFEELVELFKPCRDPFLKKRLISFLATLFDIPSQEVAKALSTGFERGEVSEEYRETVEEGLCSYPYRIIAQYLVNYPKEAQTLKEVGLLEILDESSPYTEFIKSLLSAYDSGVDPQEILDPFFQEIYSDLFFSPPFEDERSAFEQILHFIMKERARLKIERIKECLEKGEVSFEKENIEQYLYQIKHTLRLKSCKIT